MTGPLSKRPRTGDTDDTDNQPAYTLLYHPGIPGRGEYIRLALEAACVPYADPANDSSSGAGYEIVKATCDPSTTRDADGNPPVFAPPALRVPGAGRTGRALVIHQTPNILRFLGPRLGLVPDDEEGGIEGMSTFYVDQIMLTALDVSNEAHDVHHPVAVGLHYEDQKPEAARRAKDFRESRMPKFFSYFERVLRGNEDSGKGKYLVGGKLTYADTTWWQVLDGLHFAFPKEMEARRQEFPLLFTKFYPGIREEPGIKVYLASKRRLPYSMGLYRHYPELDRQ